MDLASSAEEAGWDGFFLWDHVMYEPAAPLVDAWLALSAIAVCTSTIRLGPLVTPLARRRPWKVAREAVTLDHLSNGRLILGVGLGIDYWHEFSAFAEAAHDDLERAQLVDEGTEIMWQLWSGEPVSYTGRRLSVDGACFLPRPRQRPRIPTWSALGWPASKPGPIRRAARCDGVMPMKLEPFTPDEAARLVDEISALRTSEWPLDVCIWGPGNRAAEFERAGATWLFPTFIVPDVPIADVRRQIADGPPRG
jgi:alkanesulfonate monooxygenase SsuD/methylene tetrahydromethanopterin reductase-like flavin-dependent oxidoreductase (luciferase family)